MKKIAIIGSGSWGSALAIYLGNKGENVAAQHNEEYFVSEKAILLGVQVMYEIAKKYLNNTKLT